MTFPIEHLPWILLAAAAIGFFAWNERKHAVEIGRKDKLLADLLDRLMSRDVGEYSAVRAERVQPDRPKPPEFYQTEDENVTGFQSVGDDWPSPEKWLKDYQEGIAAQAGKAT